MNVVRVILTMLRVAIVYRTRLNPIWLVVAGAVLGVTGLVS